MTADHEQSFKTQIPNTSDGVGCGPEELLAPAEAADVDENEWIEVQNDESLECQPCGEAEIEPLRVAPSPKLPSPADVEEHRLTHNPYRSWCKFCVMGRGLGEKRGHHTGRVHQIPRVGVDYWYITTDGLKRRKELEEPETPEGDAAVTQQRVDGTIMKCIVMRCYETKNVFGHVVPCKGSDEDRFVVNLIVDAVNWLGHVKIILKTDQERSLVSLAKQALQAMRVQVEGIESATLEHSQAYDSQASGGTEVGVRSLRGQFRTLHLCLQDRVGQVIPVTHPLTSWILEHSALLLNAQHRGEDGLTAWSRARGRAFGQRLIGIGESVLYKLPLKGPQHDERGNMSARHAPGLFLGYSVKSNSYKIGLEDGSYVESRAVCRVPMETRWDAEQLKNVSCTPWSLRSVRTAQRVDFGDPVERALKADEPVAANPRRLKITMDTLREHGYTEHCRQCEHIKAFNERKEGLAHSEACRTRIVAAMSATTRGAARVQDAQDRLERALGDGDARGGIPVVVHHPKQSSS